MATRVVTRNACKIFKNRRKAKEPPERSNAYRGLCAKYSIEREQELSIFRRFSTHCRNSSSLPNSKMWRRIKSCCDILDLLESTDSCLSSHRDCHTAAEKRRPGASTLSAGEAAVQLMPEAQLSLKRGQTA